MEVSKPISTPPLIHTPPRATWGNQNHDFDDQLGPQTTGAHGDVLTSEESIQNWSVANSEIGRSSKHALDLALIFGIVGNYFSSFLNFNGDNKLTGFVGNTFNALFGLFYGRRDDEIYQIYGHGANSDIPPEIVDDRRKVADLYDFIDDAKENEIQAHMYGEHVTSKFAKWSYETSKLKPALQFIGGFFGYGVSSAIQTILDFPARIWWRIRMFASSLHANFATTVFRDLPKLGIMSIFSPDARKKLTAKIDDLHSRSVKYFDEKYEGKYKSQTSSKLGLYFHMLTDRMKEHWSGMFHPKEILDRKIRQGNFNLTTEEKRQENPDLAMDRGYIVPGSKEDQFTQRRYSFVDFTGAVSAGIGTVFVAIFDPLKAIFGLTGIEWGKNMINGFSSLRKIASLINYAGRFVVPEWVAGKHGLELCDELMNSENKQVANSELVKEYYHASRNRYLNALRTGTGMILLNAVEPIFHFSASKFSDSRFFDFAKKTIGLAGDTLFMKFFSARRQHWGKMTFVRSLLREKGLTPQELKNPACSLNISHEQIEGKITEVWNGMKERDAHELERRFGPLEKAFAKVRNWWDEVRGMFEEVGVRAKLVG